MTINNLNNVKNIDIKDATKGLFVVIPLKDHYKNMIILQINDEKAYKE